MLWWEWTWGSNVIGSAPSALSFSGWELIDVQKIRASPRSWNANVWYVTFDRPATSSRAAARSTDYNPACSSPSTVARNPMHCPEAVSKSAVFNFFYSTTFVMKGRMDRHLGGTSSGKMQRKEDTCPTFSSKHKPWHRPNVKEGRHLAKLWLSSDLKTENSKIIVRIWEIKNTRVVTASGFCTMDTKRFQNSSPHDTFLRWRE